MEMLFSCWSFLLKKNDADDIFIHKKTCIAKSAGNLGKDLVYNQVIAIINRCLGSNDKIYSGLSDG